MYTMATAKRICTVALTFSSLLLYGAVVCDGYRYGDSDYGSFSPPPSDSTTDIFEGFYDFSCPRAVTIVRELVDKFLSEDLNIAGGLQRLHFHDCWVNGCDGSVLLASTSSFMAEIDGFTNFKLRGIPQIDVIKDAIEAECPGVVSCADILALVARDATFKVEPVEPLQPNCKCMVGGPWWNVPLGRRDGFVSRAVDAESNLPFPNFNWTELVQNFWGKGFTAREMVIMSGSHTIGRTHCNAISPQLYNFTGIDDLTNPALDPTFAADLIQKCPTGNTMNIVDMDPTKNVFDELYFQSVLAGKGVFTTDMALIEDPLGLEVVTQSAGNASTFFDEYAAAMVKLGYIELLTGAQGEVRKHCQYINS